MRFRPSAACAVLALGALLPITSWAQSNDAYVLPFGTIRIGVEAEHVSYKTRFDSAGEEVPLGSEFSVNLTPGQYPLLQPLTASLAELLQSTGGIPDGVDPSALSLGELEIGARGNRTEAAARISIGVAPRLEIGARLPMGRAERLVYRQRLEGGTLGLNPDAAANQEILEAIGWSVVGESPLLPLADSPTGIALQDRVGALTGETFLLPDEAVGADVLNGLLLEQYGFGPLDSRLEQWRIGDLELDARGLLLSTFGDAPVPPEARGVHLRVAALAGLRLPTGTESDTVDLFYTPPPERLANFSAGAAADLFIGPRIWITGALRQSWGRESELTRRLAPVESPLQGNPDPVLVRISPGDALELRVTPRVRLADAISVSVEYLVLQVGDTRFRTGPGGEEASLLDLPGGTVQRVGVGMRYSSLPAHWLGQAWLPGDVSIDYQRTLDGAAGTLGGGRLLVSASVAPRIW